MAVRVGINGFGRIGRNVLRAAVLMKQQALEFVAVNDITDTKTLAHLLKYDSIHRRFPGTVEAQGDALVVNGKPIKVSAIKEPEKLPWKALGVDLVLESTGRFTDRPDADKHLAAGAKKVVISAPAKGEDITIVMGVNHLKYDPAKHHVLSNASCTTNCLVPVVKVVLDNWGFKHGFMTTIHSYTNDQQILDLPHKDLRRARAAALSIIPTTTGAAKATSLVIPEVKGKIDGISLRVPTPDVSIVELTADVEKKTPSEEVTAAFKQAARSSLKGILDVSDEPLVSTDYIGSFYSSVVDALSTAVIDGTFLHVSSWYDNEMGYSARCVDLLAYIAAKGKSAACGTCRPRRWTANGRWFESISTCPSRTAPSRTTPASAPRRRRSRTCARRARGWCCCRISAVPRAPTRSRRSNRSCATSSVCWERPWSSSPIRPRASPPRGGCRAARWLSSRTRASGPGKRPTTRPSPRRWPPWGTST